MTNMWTFEKKLLNLWTFEKKLLNLCESFLSTSSSLLGISITVLTKQCSLWTSYERGFEITRIIYICWTCFTNTVLDRLEDPIGISCCWMLSFGSCRWLKVNINELWYTLILKWPWMTEAPCGRNHAEKPLMNTKDGCKRPQTAKPVTRKRLLRPWMAAKATREPLACIV